MKNLKELKQGVTARMMCCWGESASIFFIAAGGIAIMFMGWLMVVDRLRSLGISDSGRRVDLSNGAVLAVTAAAAAILWLLAVPFSYGVKWYNLQQVRGISVHARSIFICYGSLRRMGQVYRMSLVLFVRRLYFIIPLSVLMAGGCAAAATMNNLNDGIAYSALAVLILLVAVCLLCASVMFNFKFAAAKYLFVLEPYASPAELIGKSLRITKDRSDYLMNALLSVTGWLLPCAALFPAVFSLPFISMVYTAAINEVIEAGENDDAAAEHREDISESERRIHEYN